jgi:hypothetical protein
MKSCNLGTRTLFSGRRVIKGNKILPAPDVRYVVDGSLEHGHIAGDTHFYMLEIEPDADNLVDNFGLRSDTRTHWESMLDMGHHFEQHLIGWRATNPTEAPFASLAALQSLPATFKNLTEYAASKMVDGGFTTLSKDAKVHLEKEIQFDGLTRIMARSLARAGADFRHATPDTLEDVRILSEGRQTANRRAYDEAMIRLREQHLGVINGAYVRIMTTATTLTLPTTVGTNVGTINTGHWVTSPNAVGQVPTNIGMINGSMVYLLDEQIYLQDGTHLGAFNPLEGLKPEQVKAQKLRADAALRRTQKMLIARADNERRVIKRSYKFLTKLIGQDTTRMFIGGNAIRFEGKHAIYELKKMSTLNNPHGGYRALAVFSKENPDLMLCEICIYSQNVPLLDHVASLILHIRAGEEEDILRIGNCCNVDASAYKLDWLAPYLPKPYNDDDMPRIRLNEIVFGGNGEMMDDRSRMLKAHRLESMRKIVARHLYDEILDGHLPLVRAAGLRFGNSRPRWVTNTMPEYHVDENPPIITLNTAIMGNQIAANHQAAIMGNQIAANHQAIGRLQAHLDAVVAAN